MTYLITWLTIVLGITTYELVVRREFDARYFDAVFWSMFALLMHDVAFS